MPLQHYNLHFFCLKLWSLWIFSKTIISPICLRAHYCNYDYHDTFNFIIIIISNYNSHYTFPLILYAIIFLSKHFSIMCMHDTYKNRTLQDHDTSIPDWLWRYNESSIINPQRPNDDVVHMMTSIEHFRRKRIAEKPLHTLVLDVLQHQNRAKWPLRPTLEFPSF